MCGRTGSPVPSENLAASLETRAENSETYAPTQTRSDASPRNGGTQLFCLVDTLPPMPYIPRTMLLDDTNWTAGTTLGSSVEVRDCGLTRRTRIAQFLHVNRLTPANWARAARLNRTQFHHYLAGRNPQLGTAYKLLRSASELLHRKVHLSELYELGEDVPVGDVVQSRPPRSRRRYGTVDHGTPFNHLLAQIEWCIASLAPIINVSRKTLFSIRAGHQTVRISSIRNTVAGLRRIGFAVKASEVIATTTKRNITDGESSARART